MCPIPIICRLWQTSRFVLSFVASLSLVLWQILLFVLSLVADFALRP